MMRNTWSSIDISYYFIHVNFFETRARVGPGPDLLDRANAGPRPGPVNLGQGRPGLAHGQSNSALQWIHPNQWLTGTLTELPTVPPS